MINKLSLFLAVCLLCQAQQSPCETVTAASLTGQQFKIQSFSQAAQTWYDYTVIVGPNGMLLQEESFGSGSWILGQHDWFNGMEEHFSNGDFCGPIGAPRTATTVYSFGPTTKILDVSEDVTCQYHIEIQIEESVCEQLTCTGCRVRRSWTQMAASSRKSYIDLLTSIRAGSHGSDIQTRYNDLIKLHSNNFGAGIHWSAVFLPWHRWYILQMENLLREVEPCVTIPFWEWEMHAANSKLWTNDYPVWGADNYKLGSIASGGCVSDGPFAEAGYMKTDGTCITRAQQGTFATLADIQTLMVENDNPSDFNEFRNTLEDHHGTLHCRVGGDFCTGNSADLPEFFLHHGNVDRMWAKWQEQGAAFVNAWDSPSTFNNVMPATNGATPAQFADLSSHGVNGEDVCVQYESVAGGLDRRQLADSTNQYDMVADMVENLPHDVSFWKSISHVTPLTTTGLREWIVNTMLNTSGMSAEEVEQKADQLVDESGLSAYVAERLVDLTYDPHAESSTGCEAFSRISGATCASVQAVLESNPEWSSSALVFQNSIAELDNIVTPVPSTSPTTTEPSIQPTTDSPTSVPSTGPTASPSTDNPTVTPTALPTSDQPSLSPSVDPTVTPTAFPTSDQPSLSPTVGPTLAPTSAPSITEAKTEGISTGIILVTLGCILVGLGLVAAVDRCSGKQTENADADLETGKKSFPKKDSATSFTREISLQSISVGGTCFGEGKDSHNEM